MLSVPDGTPFQSSPLGAGATGHQTTSRLLSGKGQNFQAGRTLTVNGREMPSQGDWPYRLPTQRKEGYCSGAASFGVK